MSWAVEETRKSFADASCNSNVASGVEIAIADSVLCVVWPSVVLPMLAIRTRCIGHLITTTSSMPRSWSTGSSISGGGGGGGGGSGGGDRFASPRRSVLDRTSDLTTLSLPAPPVVYHPLYSAPMLPPGHRFPMVHR